MLFDGFCIIKESTEFVAAARFRDHASKDKWLSLVAEVCSNTANVGVESSVRQRPKNNTQPTARAACPEQKLSLSSKTCVLIVCGVTRGVKQH